MCAFRLIRGNSAGRVHNQAGQDGVKADLDNEQAIRDIRHDTIKGDDSRSHSTRQRTAVPFLRDGYTRSHLGFPERVHGDGLRYADCREFWVGWEKRRPPLIETS